MINIPALSIWLRLMVTSVAVLVYFTQGLMVYKLYSNGLMFDSDLIAAFIRQGYLDVRNVNTSSCSDVDCKKHLADVFGDTYERMQAERPELHFRQISDEMQLCVTLDGLQNGLFNLTLV